MSDKKSIALIVIIALMAGLGFAAAAVYTRTTKDLVNAKKRVQELEFTKLQTSVSISPAIEMKLAGFATDTRELLERSPLLNILSDVREVSPGVVIALIERQKEDLDPYEIRYRNSSYATVWLFDLHDNARKQLSPDLNVDYGNSVRLGNWLHGITIETLTSPGEAVGSILKKYLDASGNIVAEVYSGDYEKPANGLVMQFKEKKFNLQLIQKSTCSGLHSTYSGFAADESAWSEGAVTGTDAFPPTTTLIGIEVNGKLFAFPHPTIAECNIGYGESVGEPAMPDPYFDGKKMSFHLPGVDVTFSLDGTIRYSPAKAAYTISCELGSGAILRLLREDQLGTHSVIPNIWADPILQKYNTGKYCFESKSLNGNIASFSVQKSGKYVFEDAGTVDYNTQTGKFENLILNK